MFVFSDFLIFYSAKFECGITLIEELTIGDISCNLLLFAFFMVVFQAFYLHLNIILIRSC